MKTLDCRGLACPQPVMRTRDALEQERPQELLVLVDNAAASENVSRFLRRSGFEVSVSQPESSLWEVRGLGGATQVESPEQAPAAAPAVDTENLKTLVLITTDTLGRGDDELGARLMEKLPGQPARTGAVPVAHRSAQWRRQTGGHGRQVPGYPEAAGKQRRQHPGLRHLPELLPPAGSQAGGRDHQHDGCGDQPFPGRQGHPALTATPAGRAGKRLSLPAHEA